MLQCGVSSTNSIEHSHFSEVTNRTNSEGFSLYLTEHEGSLPCPLVRMPDRMDSFRTVKPYFLYIHFRITLPSILRSSKLFPPFTFPD
jgi:hypothetical protein